MNKNVLEYGIRRVLCMAAFDINGGDDVVDMYLKISELDKNVFPNEIGSINGFSLCGDNYRRFSDIFERFDKDRKFIKHMTNTLWRDYQEETDYQKPVQQLDYEEDYDKAMAWLSNEDRLISVALRSILKISEETNAKHLLNDLLQLEGKLPQGISGMQHCHCNYENSKELIKRFDESFFLIHSIRYDLARSFVTPN